VCFVENTWSTAFSKPISFSNVTYKIVIVGDCGVGKTSLILRWAVSGTVGVVQTINFVL